MTNFKWDKEQLRKEKKEIYKALLNPNLTKMSKKVLETKLEVLTEMERKLSFKNLFSQKFPVRYFDKDFNIQVAKEGLESSITYFQNDIMTVFFEEFLSKDFGEVNEKHLKTFLPEDSVIPLAKETYLKFGGDLNDFERITNPSNHYLHICKYNKGNYFFPYGNRAYILSHYKNDICSFGNLIHELGHYLEYCFFNYFIIDEKKNYLYSEISSILFEHIGLEILKNHEIINDEKLSTMQKNIMYVNTEDIDNYFILRSIAYDPKPTFNDKIKVHFYKDTFYDSAYFFSYILAVNLYYQYLEDPKNALVNLKHLIMDFDESKEMKLLEESGIDLSGNVLRKHLNKMKKSD